MKKYMRIYKTFVKNSLRRAMAFRFNFFMHMLTVLLGYLGNVLFFYFVYESGMKDVAGWRRYEVYVLLATVWIIDSIFGGVFFFNLIRIPGKVKTYELDYELLKPINSVFLLSCRQFNFGLFSGVFFGSALLIYSLIKIEAKVNIFNVIVYLIMTLTGVMLLFSLLFMIVSFSLRYVRIDGLISMFWNLVDVGKKPYVIYPKPLRAVFCFIIPSLVIYNFPTLTFVTRHKFFGISHMLLMVTGLLLAEVFVLFSVFFFKQSLRRYYA